MKNAMFRKLCLFFSPVLIFMLHLPFVFAMPRAEVEEKFLTGAETNSSLSAALNSASVIYQSLQLDLLGLSAKAYEFAISGMEKLKQQGRIENDGLITIVDFTRSSAQKRLFIIDLKNGRLLFNTYVAHGQNSGTEYANRFSNAPESFQSSLGFYETSDTYNGKNGYSLRLRGLEKGINNNADNRAIVMHGAPYVCESYIRERGYIGRSWGCPAVPEKLSTPIINRIKNGTCLFIYGADKNYLRHSKLINS